MILVVSKNQNLSELLKNKIINIGEEFAGAMPGFSFVNQFLELEIDSINGIIFDEESMDRTISLLEKSGELELIKTINLLKIVETYSDEYVYSMINAIELEEKSIDEQLDVLLKSFLE